MHFDNWCRIHLNHVILRCDDPLRSKWLKTTPPMRHFLWPEGAELLHLRCRGPMWGRKKQLSQSKPLKKKQLSVSLLSHHDDSGTAINAGSVWFCIVDQRCTFWPHFGRCVWHMLLHQLHRSFASGFRTWWKSGLHGNYSRLPTPWAVTWRPCC